MKSYEEVMKKYDNLIIIWIVSDFYAARQNFKITTSSKY